MATAGFPLYMLLKSMLARIVWTESKQTSLNSEHAPDLHPAQSNCATACSNNDNHSSKAVSKNILSSANPANCLDEDRSCVTWEGQGECLTKPAFMLKACRQACGVCQPAVRINHQARNCHWQLHIEF